MKKILIMMMVVVLSFTLKYVSISLPADCRCEITDVSPQGRIEITFYGTPTIENGNQLDCGPNDGICKVLRTGGGLRQYNAGEQISIYNSTANIGRINVILLAPYNPENGDNPVFQPNPNFPQIYTNINSWKQATNW